VGGEPVDEVSFEVGQRFFATKDGVPSILSALF
jgi:hypothetical protein